MNHKRSETLFSQAKQALVGGVNSPVRAFGHVGGTPPFIKRAKGAYLWDEDGNRYIDYVGAWGPAILGHAPGVVLDEVQKAIEAGTTFGAPCAQEVTLANLIKRAIPSIELIRFTNSGTEAAMGAIRAARAFTGRDNIIKFDGCYHGHADYLLVKSGSGALTCGTPDSKGVPEDFARHTLVAKYNDLASVERLFERADTPSPRPSPTGGGGIACVIVEPVAGNVGCIPPKEGFLNGLRELCSKHGSLLIFDEVMTGFRVAFGGAQTLYNVKPDLTCLGKIIGGGFPVGAFGGRADIIQTLAPLGGAYQAGTFSGNPVTMTAGIKTLELLNDPLLYKKLDHLTKLLVDGLSRSLTKNNIPHTTTRVGSMWTVFFTSKDTFVKYFHHMLENGVYLAPSPYESGFVSAAHTEEDIRLTAEIASSRALSRDSQ
jgi:glutamate-1-semialdehyde 2,1-aminomutase